MPPAANCVGAKKRRKCSKNLGNLIKSKNLGCSTFSLKMIHLIVTWPQTFWNSPMVSITPAQQKKGWVCKGRLKFERVCGTDVKKYNMRYPYNRKVTLLFFPFNLFFPALFVSCPLLTFCILQQHFEEKNQAENFAKEWVQQKLCPKSRKRKGNPNPNPIPIPIPIIPILATPNLSPCSQHPT